MPFADVPVSPRPLPPGRVRRSSSKPQLLPAGTPFTTRAPPPYTPVATGTSETRSSTPDLLEQLTSSIDEGRSVPAPVYLEGSSVSTEDLEGLLLRAGNIIREREQELDITSQTCKTLSENNATLKARNDALLARLPSSKPTSPVSSPPQAYTSLSSLSPHISGSQIPSLSGPTSSPPLPTSIRQRHARKPSAPAELAVLADQNAELLSKLQDLESDAARSEQAGKRRLRALEREIGMLKEELDKTRALGERLEESLQSQAGGSAGNGEGKRGLPEEMERELIKVWKRLAREAKVKEMRAKARPWEVEESEPKDFAPSNPLFAPVRTSTPDKRPNEASSSSSQYRASTEPGSQPKISADPDDPFQSATHPLAESDSETSSTLPAQSNTSLSPGRERAIVAQLLAKIAELEETNTSLAEEHQASQARLREAEREADGVRALCEIISEEVELEIVDSHEEGVGEPGGLLGERCHELGGLGSRRSESSPRRTIRLRSLGRKSSLNFDSTDGGTQSNEGRLRKFSSMDNLASGSGQLKRRDSAPQINNALAEDERPGLRPRKSVPRMRKSVRGLFDNSLASDNSAASSTMHFESGLPGIDEGPVSPDRESGRFDFPPPPIVTSPGSDCFGNGSYLPDEERYLPSLSSEMGGEAGLGLMPSMSHMRSNSIVELLNKAESEPAPGGATFPPPTHISNPASSPSLSRRRGVGMGGRNSSNSSTIPKSSAAGTIAKRYSEDDLSMRSASLSEEVMFPRLRRARSSILSSHSLTFENQALSVLQENQEPLDSVAQPDLHRDQSFDTPGTTETSSVVNEKQRQRKQRTKSAALLIELWLWLQFAVVIVVFLFAMARMGPRTFFRKSKATAQRPAGH